MFEVKTGSVAVDVLSITNIDELKKELGEKTANEVVCNNATDKKELTETISHYKKIRTPLKNEKAAARKQIDLIKKNVSDEFDLAINLVSGYIEPYESVVKEYDDKVKREKRERLQAELQDHIASLNTDIEGMNRDLQFTISQELEFSEDWAKNLKNSLEYIKTYRETAEQKYNQANNNIAALEILCGTLKNQYEPERTPF